VKFTNNNDNKKLVPSEPGTEPLNLSAEERLNNFRVSVKVLKLWSMRRGIYSNILGYLGGMTLAILIAKIAQMYPNYGPSKIIERFFFIYQFFPWDEIPLRVMPEKPNLELIEPLKNSKGYFKKDDPNSTQATKKLLNIITPAFPEMNCAFSITESQEKIVTKAIGESFKVVRLIQENELQWYFLTCVNHS
jgi:poly(A) polymerase